MPITKLQAQTSIKNLQVEASSLNPSTIIDLFTIDFEDIALSRGVNLTDQNKKFRFHNQIKLTTSSIYWQGQEYVAAPIEADGFGKSSQGTLNTPNLRMSISSEGISLLAILKNQIKQSFGDLVGCKLIRNRVFAKFLTLTNFNDNNHPNNIQTDEFSEFPSEIWWFERLTRENKSIIEYQLASLLDLENIKLPRRTIQSKSCNFSYRGEGCLYEKNDRRNDDVHGEFATLPNLAPPIATEEDKLITDILGVSLSDQGNYKSNQPYQKGQYVYITQQGIKYYFVAKTNVGAGFSPPNANYWIADKCSKCIKGCKLRWDNTNINVSPLIRGQLPFGGFPSTERLRGQ